jgi:hypothetical protein
MQVMADGVPMTHDQRRTPHDRLGVERRLMGLIVSQNRKYPPAEPGALVWEPLKAAYPGAFGAVSHLPQKVRKRVANHAIPGR